MISIRRKKVQNSTNKRFINFNNYFISNLPKKRTIV